MRNPLQKLALGLLLAFVPGVFAQTANGLVNVDEQLAPWRAYYGQQTTWPRSHGWKPFKRFEWDMMQRAYPNGTIPVGALWTALEERGRMPRVTLDENWINLGPYNHGGRSRVLRWHPDDTNIMFAGAVGGGLWRSNDAGLTWQPITDHLPNLAVGCFEIDYSNPQIMYLGTGEGYFNADAVMGIGLLKSIDGGATWNQTGLTFNYSQGQAILQIDIDPRDGNIVLASTGSGLRRSTDGGATFTSVLPGNVNALERDPQNPDVLVAGTGNPFGDGNNGIYRSENNGLNWTRCTEGLPTTTQFGRAVLAFYPANAQIIYAGICGTFSYNSSQMIGIFRSVDNGITWTQMSQEGQNHYASQGWYDMAIAVKPNQSTIVFSAGLDIHRSNNSGLFFTRKSRWDVGFENPDFVHADNHGVYFHPDDPNQVWTVTDGGVFKSVDLGENWIEMNDGYVTYQYYAMGNATLDTALAYGGAQDNGTTEYDGDGDWDEVFGGDGGYCVVDYSNNNTVYVEYQNGNRYRSDNGANNFVSINNGINGDGAWVTPMALDPFDHLTLYTTASGGGGNVWKSPNQGRSGDWETVGQSLGGELQVIALSPARQDRVYVGSNGSVFRSDDGGNFVNVSQGLPGSYVTRVVPDPFNPDLVYVTLSGFGSGHVWKSTQGGGAWQNISCNLPNCPFQDVAVDLNDPQVLYAGGDIGVFYTSNGGQTWEIYGDGLPAVRVDDMDMQTATGVLRVATHGRGMWEIPTGSAALTMFYPNGGEAISPGNPIEIRWGGASFGGNVRVEINRAYPGGAWQNIFASTPNDGLQSWTVTGPESDHVRFRVTHITIAGQSDTSNADSRIIDPSFEILWPNGGETVFTGLRSDTIRFARVLATEPVRIELNRDYPGGTWETLESNVTLDEVVWQTQLPGGTNCRVRVVSETRPEILDESDANFTLRMPQMTLTAPADGEQLLAGIPYTIRWSADEHEGRVRLLLNRDYPDGAWEVLRSSQENTGFYNWLPNEPGSEHCRIRLVTQFDQASYVDGPGDFAITGTATGDARVPSVYRLSEPFPNPFNPTTSITLELPARTLVTAVALNSLGQTVATLTDGNLEAGVHHLSFDGSELSSGVYFIRVEAYHQTQMLKVALVK